MDRQHGRHEFDVIVVLGAAVLPDGRPNAAMGRRVAQGVALFKTGKAEALLLTGGKGNHVPSEAEAMRRLALMAGVPERVLVLERRARSTLENALYSARLMRERGWSSALVVTDWLHLPRALLAFRGAGIDATGSGIKGGWREEPVRLWLYYLAYEAVAFVCYSVLIVIKRHRHPGGPRANPPRGRNA